MMKAFITKYALTKGILEVEGNIPENFPNMFSVPISIHSFHAFHGEGKDWHRTRHGAEMRAEEIRLAEIESLTKRIARLRKLSFTAA
jgi:hypothetical protein